MPAFGGRLDVGSDPQSQVTPWGGHAGRVPRDMFVLKGRLLISSWVGLAVRTTMNMDGSLHGMPITEENVKRFISEIVAVKGMMGLYLK